MTSTYVNVVFYKQICLFKSPILILGDRRNIIAQSRLVFPVRFRVTFTALLRWCITLGVNTEKQPVEQVKMMDVEAINSQQNPFFVACGMYAFTADLRDAWQQLFEHFFHLINPAFELDRVLKFESGQTVLNDPALWFGQACGYPLMTRLRDTLTPISVPVFDIHGCDHTSYSSLLIVPVDSKITTLQQCQGLRAVINTSDSNSGMNVLRHAVAAFNRQGTFFSRIKISGSHLKSLTEVANQRADIAAIDCVSYRFIEDSWPELAARVRSIGFSAKTCGLPFVMPNPGVGNNNLDGITENLNQALSLLADKHKGRLHLQAFEKVDIDEYQGVLDLEISAREAGYPVLT